MLEFPLLDWSFIMNSNSAFSLTQVNWFYGILHVYFQSIFKEKDLEPESFSIER